MTLFPWDAPLGSPGGTAEDESLDVLGQEQGTDAVGTRPVGSFSSAGSPALVWEGALGHLRRASDLSAEHQGDLGSASYVKENSRELGGLSLAFGATALGQALP